MSKLRVDVEECQRWYDWKKKVNSVELKDIEWYQNGKKIEYSKEDIEEFNFTRLNNFDFIKGRRVVDSPDEICWDKRCPNRKDEE